MADLLYTIFVILLILWLLGFVGSIGGGLIHLLLVIAVIVIIIRLIRHKPLFIGDNRHIHHLLLRAGCTHIKATLLISLANIFIIVVAFLLDDIGIILLALVILFISVLLTTIVYFKVSQKENWNWESGILNTILKEDKLETSKNIE